MRINKRIEAAKKALSQAQADRANARYQLTAGQPPLPPDHTPSDFERKFEEFEHYSNEVSKRNNDMNSALEARISELEKLLDAAGIKFE